MGIIVRLLLLNLLFFSTLLADNKTLKIAIPYEMTPYAFVEDGNIPNGILIDFWKLWAKKNNQKIEFVPSLWIDTLSAIKKGEVDIHSGLFKNRQREEFLTFLDPIYLSESHIYFNKELQGEIKSIEDVKNRVIGVENGSFYESYLSTNYPKLKIKKYDSFSKMFAAMKNKEIDLLIEDSLVIQRFLMKDASFSKVEILPEFEIFNWFYAGIKKGDDNLKELVNKGLKKITQDELKEIEKKWVVKDKFKYLKNKKVDKGILSQEERIWLSNNKNITLAVTNDWVRYSYTDLDGKLKGFHLDLIKQINENLGINIEYRVFNTWNDAYTNARNSIVDGILGLSWSKEREEFFDYSPSYHTGTYYIVTREDEKASSLVDFNDKIAVTYENSITNKIIKEKTSKIKFIHKKSIEGILKAIQNKEADVATLEGAYELDLKRYGLKIVDVVYTKYSEFFIGTTKGEEVIQTIIKKGVESISKEQIKALEDRWLNKKIVFTKEEIDYIKNSPTLKVGIEEWSGIIGSKDGKNLDGIAGELVQKAFEISGLNIEYIKGDWSEIHKKFKEKEIDILPASIYTKPREEYGIFSQKYFSMKHLIYVKSSNNIIKSLSDLQNKKLAVQKDSGPVSLIKELYPKIEIVEAKDLDGLFQKLLNGEVDALFEAQLAVQNKMREQLITNIKSVSQNSLKDQGLHIFLKKDPILRTILDKSISLIPQKEKSRIISKWLYDFNEVKGVNIAFGLGRDPYILDKNFMKGIEYDLINKILNLSSINIKSKKNVSVEEMKEIFNTNFEIDMAVSVKEEKDSELFYSDVFMKFHNVLISRKEDNLKINSISDLAKLKDKKIVAFLDAYKYLGDEYYNLYNINNRPDTYSEISFQRGQVDSFFKKETDLIVLDKNIFKWFFNELNGKDISNYTFHYIFSGKNEYKVAFKDKNLRDVFNRNLNIIRKNGDYEEIFNNYTQGYIKSKVKINSLISFIIGKYIFDNNLVELKKTIEVFSKLPYIEKIEVFDSNNELLISNTQKESSKFILTDTYHFIDNLPQKVGFIKVYFNNELLKKYENSLAFIPSINEFEKFNSFNFIKEVYGKFEYISSGIEFTQKELAFIRNKKKITFSNVNWEPLSIVEGDNITGLFSDYMKIIEEKTGLKFEFIKTPSWMEVLQKFRKGELDVVPNIGDAAFNFKNGVVSNSVVSFRYAIVSSSEGTYLDGLSELKGKTVALPKGYSSNTLIKKNYPEIKIVPAKSVNDALKMVSKNEVDAFVGHSAIVVHSVKNNFPDLKIIGLSEEYFNHYILIQDKYPELLSIINKAISSITIEEKQKIKDKWIRIEVDTAIDYSILYFTIAFFLTVLIIVLIFTNKLSAAKKLIENRNKKIEETLRQLEDSNYELETTIKNLKQTQEQLIESEKMASLAGLVAGVAHEINTPIGIGLTGSTHLSEMTSNIKKSYNEKDMTQEAFEKYLNTTEELTSLVTNNLNKAANLVKSFKQVAVDQASEEKRTFELKEYIDEILFSLNSVLKKTNLKMNIICDKDIVIDSYPGAISQILTNLIMNSIIHGYDEHEEGIITIEVIKSEVMLKMAYKDDGKGISKENISKIFEPFFTTNREKGGSGLGLNIIYNIVTSSLNGKIRCIETQKGAEFEIEIPLDK